KYRFAGTLLEQLRKAHPDWQPAIVEYRGRKVSEAILRVQDKAGTQENVTATTEPAAETVLPQNSPPVQIVREAPSATPNEIAIEQHTQKLRDHVDQLEAKLQKSPTQMTPAKNKKQSLNSRLDETKSKLDKAQGELKKAKTAETQVREQ